MPNDCCKVYVYQVWCCSTRFPVRAARTNRQTDRQTPLNALPTPAAMLTWVINLRQCLTSNRIKLEKQHGICKVTKHLAKRFKGEKCLSRSKPRVGGKRRRVECHQGKGGGQGKGNRSEC